MICSAELAPPTQEPDHGFMIARSVSPWRTGLRHAWPDTAMSSNTGATKTDVVVAVVRMVVVAGRATAVLCCIDPRAATQNRPLDDTIPILPKFSGSGLPWCDCFEYA